MGAWTEIVTRQVEWAKARGLRPDSKGYLPSVGENLFAPLSPATEAEFRKAGGNELEDRLEEPAKMRALYSSSALVCNVFDPLRSGSGPGIARALGISGACTETHFEAQLPSGLRGTPPTLDLVLVASESLAWGIESKFTEPFQCHQRRAPFAKSYFDAEVGLWTALGLPKCQALAKNLSSGTTSFAYLDAPQLLKHSLGLRRRYRNAQLLLLWYEAKGPESTALRSEIYTFSTLVDPSLGFHAITYREVFARLSTDAIADIRHVDYLRARYFDA